jgi:PTH2 family peptidyl-tRNA hydrolase
MEKIDPIIMYFVVRRSLGMSIGKTAAQCAHATQMLFLEYDYLSRLSSIPSDVFDKLQIMDDWLKSDYRKVILRADEKEWLKLKELSDKAMVIDSGLTELLANTETVIAFWPMYKSKVPRVIRRLQVLN